MSAHPSSSQQRYIFVHKANHLFELFLCTTYTALFFLLHLELIAFATFFCLQMALFVSSKVFQALLARNAPSVYTHPSSKNIRWILQALIHLAQLTVSVITSMNLLQQAQFLAPALAPNIQRYTNYMYTFVRYGGIVLFSSELWQAIYACCTRLIAYTLSPSFQTPCFLALLAMMHIQPAYAQIAYALIPCMLCVVAIKQLIWLCMNTASTRKKSTQSFVFFMTCFSIISFLPTGSLAFLGLASSVLVLHSHLQAYANLLAGVSQLLYLFTEQKTSRHTTIAFPLDITRLLFFQCMSSLCYQFTLVSMPMLVSVALLIIAGLFILQHGQALCYNLANCTSRARSLQLLLSMCLFALNTSCACVVFFYSLQQQNIFTPNIYSWLLPVSQCVFFTYQSGLSYLFIAIKQLLATIFVPQTSQKVVNQWSRLRSLLSSLLRTEILMLLWFPCFVCMQAGLSTLLPPIHAAFLLLSTGMSVCQLSLLTYHVITGQLFKQNISEHMKTLAWLFATMTCAVFCLPTSMPHVVLHIPPTILNAWISLKNIAPGWLIGVSSSLPFLQACMLAPKSAKTMQHKPKTRHSMAATKPLPPASSPKQRLERSLSF